MKRERIDIPGHIWSSIFGREISRNERLELLRVALVGVEEWSDFLNVSVRRVRQIIEEHSIRTSIREARTDEIASCQFLVRGHIFDPVACKAGFYSDDDDVIDDGRRKALIPICFDKKELMLQWHNYQSDTKSERRRAAVKGVSSPLTLPSEVWSRGAFIFDGDGNPISVKLWVGK